jgi:Ser/Thr protein kinase RdoA (MazF antagonist)
VAHLLEHVPVFGTSAAIRIAEDLYRIRASASALPSERDQNFLLIDSAGETFVLKIANALETRALLDAQSSALEHLRGRVSFCQQVVPSTSGELIETVEGHFVRLMTYLPGVPLAEIKVPSPELLRDLGRKLGQLDRALADFDHPAVHRDFHWDLSNGSRVINEFGPLITDINLRELVFKCQFHNTNFRKSVIHGDANDYNVLVDPQRSKVTGLIDFGDMVYSYTIGNLAVAIAYVVLEKEDPHAVAEHVVAGYVEEFQLLEEELEALWKLVRLRLAMSVCVAVDQLRQRPANEYLGISQKAIAETLPKLIDHE